MRIKEYRGWLRSRVEERRGRGRLRRKKGYLMIYIVREWVISRLCKREASNGIRVKKVLNLIRRRDSLYRNRFAFTVTLIRQHNRRKKLV